ncbi:hypothetical protein TcG_02909 [Trypanosoma cruzi]|nr:hypothetical protein TcG_02909 [Trypanosoma cruzi]
MKSRVKAGRQFLDRDAGVGFNHNLHPEGPRYNPAQVHKLLLGLPIQPQGVHPRNQNVKGNLSVSVPTVPVIACAPDSSDALIPNLRDPSGDDKLKETQAHFI